MAKNYRLMRINNERFTIRLCTVANNYGFKTVGKFEDFLNQSKLNAKLYMGVHHTRVQRLRKEIEAFKQWCEQQ